MNIQDFIESGMLELYVLNALSDDERQEVEALAQQNPEVRAELERIEDAMSAYAQARSVVPPTDLRDKILKQLDKPTPPAQPITQLPKAQTSKWMYPLSYVAIAAALALGYYAYYLNNQNKTLEKNLSDCQSTNAQLIEKQKIVADLNNKINILSNPKTKTIELKGLPIAPDARVTVYWNNVEKATLLSIQNLPAPPQNKQYQLWAIVNKQPVDAGVFEYDKTIVHQMKGFDQAEAFAITLEPTGGSVSPSLDKMYVLGTL